MHGEDAAFGTRRQGAYLTENVKLTSEGPDVMKYGNIGAWNGFFFFFFSPIPRMQGFGSQHAAGSITSREARSLGKASHQGR